jgi:hypothetical protein
MVPKCFTMVSYKALLSLLRPCQTLQSPEAALQALSRSLLALSMSYGCAYFLLELGAQLLQHILLNSSNLQGLARAAGVKLQLLVCFSAANTQVCAAHRLTQG